MKQYNNDENDDSIIKCNSQITQILNYFNHLLLCHDRNDEDIKQIYILFGGQYNVDKCERIKCHFRERTVTKQQETKESLYKRCVIKSSLLYLSSV